MADQQLVYVGTYTHGDSGGIYTYTLDETTGALTQVGQAVRSECPSFLDVDPTGRYLYAISEVGEFDGEPSGAVSAFAIDSGDGGLTLLNQRPSRGGGPCHLSVDPAGRAVFVANYGSGSVAMLPVEDDGRLGAPTSFVQHEGASVNPERQEGPHAHSITPSLDGRYVFAADLGLDKVLVYKVDYASGKLVPGHSPSVTVQAGAGPRHFAFHPTGEYGYVINELDSTMNAFAYDATAGVLTQIQSLPTLPEGFEDINYPADVHVSADGRFVYGTNRGHNSLVIFSVDADSGTLTPVDHEPTQGDFPRNFGIDLSGDCLLAANQNSDNVVSFRVDRETGRLTPTGHVAQVSAPVCVKFLRLAG